jgi:hypothetical protein
MRAIAAAVLILANLAAAAVAGDAPILPDRNLTPGDTLPVSVETLCIPGYAKGARHVAGSVKERVYRAYKLERHKGYTIDHLIAVELGGSNDPKNLWPQPLADAELKDALENRLHALVCAGSMPLMEAKALITSDWVAAYRRFIGKQ